MMAPSSTKSKIHDAASLARQLESLALEDDHEQILKHANHVLKSNPSDSMTLRTKVTALIKLERYQEALDFLDTQKELAGLDLEYGYCFYKTGNLQRALSVAASRNSSEKRVKGLRQVHAQAAYRSENFRDASNAYDELCKVLPLLDNEDHDVKVNLWASKAQMAWKGRDAQQQLKRATAQDLQTYETAFNAACLSLARGELSAALMLLRTSKKVCSGLEGISEDEIKLELAPLIAQEIFVLLKLGRFSEAEDLFISSDLASTADEAVKYIASFNNSLASSNPNPHIALRKLEMLLSIVAKSTTQQPFQFQSDVIRENSTVLAFQTGKNNSALSSATKLEERQEHCAASISSAIEIGKIGTLPSAKSVSVVLGKLSSQDPSNIGLAFINIQNHMRKGNAASAVSDLERLQQSLESKPEIRFLPALVGVGAALYTLQGRTAKVKEELEKASTYWRSTSNPNAAGLLAAANLEIHSTDLQYRTAAASLFTSLISVSPTALSNAGYVASHPADNLQQQVSDLTPIDKLLKDVNIDNLLETGVAVVTDRKRPAEESSESKTGQTRHRKKRKSKPVKEAFDPNKQPDPERWLPLRDRSTYKPKKKDKKKTKDLTQGGIVAADKDGDMEMIGGNSVTKVTAAQANAATKAKNKKKGKGKAGKW